MVNAYCGRNGRHWMLFHNSRTDRRIIVEVGHTIFLHIKIDWIQIMKRQCSARAKQKLECEFTNSWQQHFPWSQRTLMEVCQPTSTNVIMSIPIFSPNSIRSCTDEKMKIENTSSCHFCCALAFGCFRCIQKSRIWLHCACVSVC